MHLYISLYSQILLLGKWQQIKPTVFIIFPRRLPQIKELFITITPNSTINHNQQLVKTPEAPSQAVFLEIQQLPKPYYQTS